MTSRSCYHMRRYWWSANQNIMKNSGSHSLADEGDSVVDEEQPALGWRFFCLSYKYIRNIFWLISRRYYWHLLSGNSQEWSYKHVMHGEIIESNIVYSPGFAEEASHHLCGLCVFICVRNEIYFNSLIYIVSSLFNKLIIPNRLLKVYNCNNRLVNCW